MSCNEWRIEAKKMLRQGFGVEDIAIKLMVPPDDVRQFVQALRKNGRLSVVLFGIQTKGYGDAPN